jgi:hypothetical protein
MGSLEARAIHRAEPAEGHPPYPPFNTHHQKDDDDADDNENDQRGGPHRRIDLKELDRDT